MRVRWPVWSALGVAAAGAGMLLVGPPVWLVDRLAAAFPGEIDSVTLANPTLEDVFIAKTGRRRSEDEIA